MAWISSGRQDIYLDIADKYEQYIKSGLYQTGDKLPSVRIAAGDMGVNPNTVARAYALLEERGYIRALPKKGAYVIYGEEAPAPTAPDCKALLMELKHQGVRYEDLIALAKEVFDEHD